MQMLVKREHSQVQMNQSIMDDEVSLGRSVKKCVFGKIQLRRRHGKTWEDGAYGSQRTSYTESENS